MRPPPIFARGYAGLLVPDMSGDRQTRLANLPLTVSSPSAVSQAVARPAEAASDAKPDLGG